MFAGFNLSSNESFSSYQRLGEEIYNKSKIVVRNSLDKYFDTNGSINGTNLQEHWFPQIDADIFISHSHKDEKMAKGLAGWLYSNFGLTVFIDSCVWGYSLDLQKEIDYNFCRLDGKESTYSYEKVMYSTSHVHMMLSTALTKMLDKSECVIFLNTPNSLNTKDTINNTESPWIYHEIAMTKLINKRKLSEYRKGIIKEGMFNENRDLNIKYDIDLDHLEDININDLSNWAKINQTTIAEYPLDILYRNKNIL
ncbi:MAG: hypothetical protein ABS939_22430 [Psychrobacillus sp.]|uniref:hypothetical protein n=1 Tax=Solibacillus sp. FSL R7-0682 TaxID=2921690 RepID=UPI0030F8CD67